MSEDGSDATEPLAAVAASVAATLSTECSPVLEKVALSDLAVLVPSPAAPVSAAALEPVLCVTCDGVDVTPLLLPGAAAGLVAVLEPDDVALVAFGMPAAPTEPVALVAPVVPASAPVSASPSVAVSELELLAVFAARSLSCAADSLVLALALVVVVVLAPGAVGVAVAVAAVVLLRLAESADSASAREDVFAAPAGVVDAGLKA